MLRRMVHTVARPEPTHLVRRSVVDIKQEVDRQVQQAEADGVYYDSSQTELVNPVIN